MDEERTKKDIPLELHDFAIHAAKTIMTAIATNHPGTQLN